MIIPARVVAATIMVRAEESQTSRLVSQMNRLESSTNQTSPRKPDDPNKKDNIFHGRIEGKDAALQKD